MNHKLIKKSERDIPVRKTGNGSYQYRVTVPSDIVETVGFSDGQDLGFIPKVKNGNLVLEYHPEEFPNESQMRVSLNQPTPYSGVLLIPSAFGATVGIGDASVEWESVQNDEYRFLRGRTSVEIPKLPAEDTEWLENSYLSNPKQENFEYEGRTWSQEQFRHYLSDKEMDSLGWEREETFAVVVYHINGEFVLVCNPDISGEKPDNTVKKMSPTKSEEKTKRCRAITDDGEGERCEFSAKSGDEVCGTHTPKENYVLAEEEEESDYNKAGLLYLPNDIVRSVRFEGAYSDPESDEKLSWLKWNRNLIIIPAENEGRAKNKGE